MVELHHTEVDGVRCFWVETGRPTLAALLLFRQGMADEPLTESGWLHMLEHLALHGRGGGALHVNGSVTPLTTTFEAHGPHERVVDHVAQVTSWLSEPVFTALDRERGVLQAEAALRSGAVSRAYGWRYGARGPGIISYDEPGTSRATPERLASRARSVFTRQNAALVLDGPPPPGMRVTLPEGRRLAPPTALPLEPTIPGAYVEEGGLVASGVVTRSAAATFCDDVLERALRERLRDAAGVAYSPWASYEPVDGGQAVVLAGSDALADRLDVVVEGTLDALDALCANPPPEGWIADIIAEREQAVRDPYAAAGLAWRAAQDYLAGDPVPTHEEVLQEIASVDSGAVSRALQQFRTSLLLGIPSDADVGERLPVITHPEGPALGAGAVFRSIDWPAAQAHLAIGPDRVEIAVGEVARSVELDGVQALVVFDDGGRFVIGRDGWGLHVQPGAWREGAEAIEILDSSLAPDLLLPQPTPPGSAYRRLPWVLRTAAWWRHLLQHRHAWKVALAVAVVMWLAGLYVPVPGLVLPALLVLIWALQSAYEARATRRRPSPRSRPA